MHNKGSKRFTGLLVFLLIAVSCKHEIPVQVIETPVQGGEQACSPDTVYFQNKVLPLLISGCAMSGCHDAISHEDGVNLTTYGNIMATADVRPGNPGNSKLYKVLNKSGNDRMPRPPAPAFTQAQKDIIYNWILQGAKNNACNDCDSAVTSYSAAIAPLMTTYCKGCHNPASLGGGIDLSVYSGVKAVALNGKLLGSIKRQPGYIAMPQAGNKLSDCRISQVEKWVLAGAPNN